MAKISVIIPVYNAEKYLELCLDSVINQTYKDIEIICVNDGSVDGSLEVLREYEKKDNRIIVIDKANEGVSIARNVGIEKASGDYLVFVDADDSIEADCLEFCYEKIEKTNSDICCFGLNEVTDDNICPRWDSDFLEGVDRNDINVIKLFIHNACGKMFKKEFLSRNNIKFQSGIKTCEDGLFCIECLFQYPMWCAVSQNFYNYFIRRENSATNSCSNAIKTNIEAFRLLLDLEEFKKASDELKIIVVDKMLNGFYYFYNQMRNKKFRLKYAFQISSFEKELKKEINNEILSQCRNRDVFKNLKPFKVFMKSLFSIQDEYDDCYSYKQLTVFGFNIPLARRRIKHDSRVKISVVIPVYNAEDYLRECLDSVVLQTLTDIEIICVEDCSVDNSLKILEEYASKDNRIKIIKHKMNKGLGPVRNTGMNVAVSEYIFFLDSDDSLGNEFVFDKMYKYAKDTKSQIIFSKTLVYTDETDEEYIRRVNYLDTWFYYKVISNFQVNYKNWDYVLDLQCVAWGKLYQRKFLFDNNIEFINSNTPFEDNGFHVKCLSCLPNISFSDILGVKYRVRRNSIAMNIDKYRDIKYKNLSIILKDSFNYMKKTKTKSEYMHFEYLTLNSDFYKDLVPEASEKSIIYKLLDMMKK